MDVKEKLRILVKQIKETSGLTQTAIALEMGYAKNAISDMLTESGTVTPRFLLALEKHYLAKSESSEIPDESEERPAKSYRQKRLESKWSNGEDLVPVYVGNTRMGNVQVYADDPQMQQPIANLPAGLFPGCDHGEKVSGDSMYPLIINQGYVVGKIIDKRGIVWGEKYGVHTRHGINVVKYLHPSETAGMVKLKSYNKQVPDQDISLDDITFIFRVMFILNPA